MKVSITEAGISIGDCAVALPIPAERALEVAGRVIVLLDPDEMINRNFRDSNLWAFNLAGQLLWKAELPEKVYEDCYCGLDSSTPLVAWSFSSYKCTIDLSTGRILQTVFFK